MGRILPAGALASTLALGLLVVPAGPAAAGSGTAPHEIAVFPADGPTVPAHEAIIFAGKTGFLHRHDASTAYLWTRYDNGETVVVNDLAGLAPSALKPAGDDFVFIRIQVPAKPAPGKVSMLDLSDRSWEQWAVPTGANGYTVLGAYGHTVIAQKWVGGGPVGPELLTFAADGTIASSTPVAVPEGASPGSVNIAVVGDLTSTVLGYGAGTGYYAGLLDFASARIAAIPGAPTVNAGGVVWRLSGDTVGWGSYSTSTNNYWLYSRSGLTDGTNTQPRKLSIPYDTVQRSAIVADGLVTSRDGGPALAVPADGGATTTVLPRIDTDYTALVQAPDGTALVVGGTGARDWAVRRITAQPGQTPTTTPLLPVRDPVGNAGLVYHEGLVRHVQTQIVPSTGATQYAIYNHPLVDDGSVKAGADTFSHPPASCAPGVACMRLVEGNEEGVAYVSPGANGAADTVYTFRQGPSGYSTNQLPTHNGRVVDVGKRSILVNDGTSNDQYLIDNAHVKTTRLGPITGAGLWFDTLWTATSTPGQLKAVDVESGATTRTVSTGSACVPTEVQTSARWIYWSCGDAGPAGVYDLPGNRNLSVPAGPVMLGDGFLVRHENNALQLTDFHDGTVQPAAKLADLPVGNPADGRRVTWAVDRHGSGVAYVGADNAVHVIDTGIPGTPPQSGSQDVKYFFHPRSDQIPWYGSFWLTRPLTSWEMTVSAKWTGEVVHRRTGGPARELVSDTWDGKLASGKLALNGIYRWTLTGTADGTSPVTIGSGELLVSCASFGFREMGCDGGATLLGVKSTGEAHWYGTYQTGTVPGRLFDHGYTESYCLSCSGSARTSALVPFGDFDGDALPDLLVRDGSGYLRAYLGNGQLSFGGSKTKSLGAGWMMYKSILAPGDVNRDGHDDILGIDTYGKLWLYTTTGTGGINSRVQVGSGWNIYKRVIGAGDLNGDGHGDLIGIDAYGVMYTYFSNGNKGWSSRVKVYGGWNMYNTVIAIGDLNEDGRNDLVARDAYGVLWHYAGLGNGSFAARVKAGTGWNMYKVIV